jgi:hypothetical protein
MGWKWIAYSDSGRMLVAALAQKPQTFFDWKQTAGSTEFFSFAGF